MLPVKLVLWLSGHCEKNMSDKNKSAVIALKVGGIALILFLIFRKKKSTVVSDNVPGAAPNQYIYDPVLAAYNPGLGLQPSNIDVNIANQGMNYLSNKYIPLFGFVGMAQGETLH
jgi:hypothetical protein